MTDGTGTTTYQYDSLGRLTRARRRRLADVDGETLRPRRRPDVLQYPNGHTVTMQYDANGQMTCVTDWLGNTTQFQYDAARDEDMASSVRLVETVHRRVKTTTWGYDAAGQTVHITCGTPTETPYATFDYTRARDGRITAVDSTGSADPPQTYAYDADGRLGSENANPVTFDSRDNVTGLPDGSTLSYDAADQLMSSTGGRALHRPSRYNADGRADQRVVSRLALSYGVERRRRSDVVHRQRRDHDLHVQRRRPAHEQLRRRQSPPFVWDSGSRAQR